jgi:hypothetical protein
MRACQQSELPRAILSGHLHEHGVLLYQGKSSDVEGRWMDSLRRVFGNEHPILWMRLRWDLPPGTGQGEKGM